MSCNTIPFLPLSPSLSPQPPLQLFMENPSGAVAHQTLASSFHLKAANRREGARQKLQTLQLMEHTGDRESHSQGGDC